MTKSIKFHPFINIAACAVLIIAAVLGCTEPEPTPTPTPVDPSGPTKPEDKDTNAPTITLVTSAVGVYGGKTVAVADGKLSIGETEVATWTDDKSEVSKCKVDLAFTAAAAGSKAENISYGATLDKPGTLNLTVTDEAGNSANKDITITEDNSAPEVKVLKEDVDVYGGKTVTVNGNTLSIGEDMVLQWSDDYGDDCTIALSLDGSTVNIGAKVSKAGILKITVIDSKGLGTEASITLTDQILFGMESLDGLDLQIDKEVNLIGGLSFYEGWSLVKVEIEKDGVRTEVTKPEHYISSIAGDIVIIITVTDGSKTAEFKSGTLTIKPLTYTSVQPQKSEIYPDFNTANVEAYKRWGAYELRALAMSMQVRNGIPILIDCEGLYIPDNGVYKWMGGDGDGHGEEVYRNISDGTGDSDNIWATWENWSALEMKIKESQLRDKSLIITCSDNIISSSTHSELIQNEHFIAIKRIGSSDHTLIFASVGNVGSQLNYSLNEGIEDPTLFHNGRYRHASPADPQNNNIIPVTYGRFKSKAKFGVYQDQDGRGCTSACAYISKDNCISPFGCVEFSNPTKKNSNDEWSEGGSSFATPALAAMAKNAYDILHKLGSVRNMTELKNLLLKYSTKIPATRQDIAEDGTIIEDVDNGFVLVPDMLRLINEEIYPAIIGKASKNTDGTTILHKDDGLNIAYTGAGTEYQNADGSWRSTDGVAITEFFGKPQRFNPALLAKYGINGAAAITIHLTDQLGLEIVSSAVTLP